MKEHQATIQLRIALIIWGFIIGAATFDITHAHAQTPHGTMNEETPAGVIDGVNNVFTIAHQPLPWSAIKLYRNGLRQKRCTATSGPCDYNLDTSNFNATKIVFLPLPVVPPGTVGIILPVPGDMLLADYTY